MYMGTTTHTDGSGSSHGTFIESMRLLGRQLV